MIEIQRRPARRHPVPLHPGPRSPAEQGGLCLLEERRLAPGQGLPLPRRRLTLLSYLADGCLDQRWDGCPTQTLARGTLQVLELPSTRSPRQHAGARRGARVVRLGLEADSSLPCNQIARYAPRHGLMLIGSPDGEGGTLRLHHDHRLYLARLHADEAMTLPLEGRRCGYLHVVEGCVAVAEYQLAAGDGALVGRQSPLWLSARAASELLFLELGLD